MRFESREFSVRELCEAHEARSLVRNPEYQRGAAWSTRQKQGLIDSVFRQYPLPTIFLERKVRRGLSGQSSEVFEIIDGQQRILALVEYIRNNFDLLKPEDQKLRLPLSLREADAPWAGRRFADLDSANQSFLWDYKVPGYLVEGVENPDEIRDLFIRLQSGTALTRQQVRDAWPGALGPRIEQWAGKMQTLPRYRFFGAVDGRGTRDDEDDANDPYVRHRTICAQLCILMFARHREPFAAPGLLASDLDALYHEHTRAVPTSEIMTEAERVFSQIESVVSLLAGRIKGRRKVHRGALYALAQYLQDRGRNPSFALGGADAQILADLVAQPPNGNLASSSGVSVRSYYNAWRRWADQSIPVNLDPKDNWADLDRNELLTRQEGRCALCGQPLSDDAVEVEHYPVPYRDGGRTVPENGRLMHHSCQPKGKLWRE